MSNTIPSLAIDFIKKAESLRLNAYLCPVGVWTIGYGNTRLSGRAVKEGDTLPNEKVAYDLLIQQLENDFLPDLRKIPYWDEMNSNQHSVLLSFAWNLGAKFYGANGFETITTRLKNKQWNLVPSALNLYVKGWVKGKLVSLPGLVTRREKEGQIWLKVPENKDNFNMIASPPTIATVGVPFTLTGKLPTDCAGQKVSVSVGHFALPSPTVDLHGNFTLNTVLNQAGDRRIRLSIGDRQQTFTIKVNPSPAQPSPAPTAIRNFVLSGSVGQGGSNKQADVILVQQRLKDLGFNLSVDGGIGNETISRIRLFQSIIAGQSRVAGDGRVDVNGATHQWLQATNAPGWRRMPDHDPGIGFFNQELVETWDDHDFGTTWLADAILWIAKKYQDDYRSRNPKASLFTMNDVSRPHGGQTPDHSGHETGLMCDVFLPRIDGGFSLPTYDNPQYDRNACRAMLVAIRSHPLFKLAYFNDPVLIREGLCRSASGHHHHIHFEIKPPARKN